MFTGIIETTGKIAKIDKATFTIQSPFTSELIIGQSVAHDGVCLTVTSIEENTYTVDLVPETFERTNFGDKQIGDTLNLERCMKADGRFDGHIVQGHCDFVGMVKEIKKDGNAYNVSITIPTEYEKYFVEKGSITINGISLTVTEAKNESISVSIIPHTWEITNLSELEIGNTVNIETDVFAKYFVKTFHK